MRTRGGNRVPRIHYTRNTCTVPDTTASTYRSPDNLRIGRPELIDGLRGVNVDGAPRVS